MSREAVIVLRDDLDGSIEHVATHTFSLDDQNFELELSTVNWEQLRNALAEFVAVSRPVRRKRRKAKAPAPTAQRGRWTAEIASYAGTLGYDWSDKAVRDEVRRWALDSGLQVGRTGVIRRDVLDAHHAVNHRVTALRVAAPAPTTAPTPNSRGRTQSK
jgi:Lsr2